MLRKRRTNGPNLHVILGVVMFTLLVCVSSLNAKGASSIAQGFETDDPNIVAGALVSSKSSTANAVELATSENIDRMLGVAGEDSLIELSDREGTVQIVTTGETATLVSDINGPVTTGDKITASPIAGIGMKATSSILVIGSAQADLAKVETKARTIKQKNGKEQTIRIGAIPVRVDKVFHGVPADQSSFLPPVLQSFANNLAGRQVSPIRVTIAGMLTIFLFTTIVVLLYSAVRSSIISIGRNPLSGNAVHKGLVQVGLTVFGIMSFTVIVTYLILTT